MAPTKLLISLSYLLWMAICVALVVYVSLPLRTPLPPLPSPVRRMASIDGQKVCVVVTIGMPVVPRCDDGRGGGGQTTTPLRAVVEAVSDSVGGVDFMSGGSGGTTAAAARAVVKEMGLACSFGGEDDDDDNDDDNDNDNDNDENFVFVGATQDYNLIIKHRNSTVPKVSSDSPETSHLRPSRRRQQHYALNILPSPPSLVSSLVDSYVGGPEFLGGKRGRKKAARAKAFMELSEDGEAEEVADAYVPLGGDGDGDGDRDGWCGAGAAEGLEILKAVGYSFGNGVLNVDNSFDGRSGQAGGGEGGLTGGLIIGFCLSWCR